MRIRNRLNQFQRLWQPSSGAPQRVTLSELAARCFCSERHMRTLLRQGQESGWLHWDAQPGRGKRGTLTFLASPQSLRSALLEKVLSSGQQHTALELAELAPERLRTLLQPFLGGQWQNDIPTLRIPYYRSLDRLTPGRLTSRAEQHLSGQIFSGLTRFTRTSPLPEGDLAHHWQASADGRCWQFFIRPNLYWHNGERLETAQLQARLTMLLTTPPLRDLFASVKQITVTHARCLTIRLHRPDYWLPWRLASYGARLPHPQDDQLGSGPFRLVRFTPELVRLESHDRYHLQHPLLQAIEYWITPQLFEQTLGTSCRHPVQIAIGDPDELARLRPVSSRISLGFCYLAARHSVRLSAAQARRIMQIVHQSGMLQTLPLDEALITSSHDLLPGLAIPAWPPEQAALPARLMLVYHLPVELHTMAAQLTRYLSALGCELTVHFHDAKSWEGCGELAGADLVMGDRLIGEAPYYTLEQWLRGDRLWPALLPAERHTALQATLNAVQARPDDDARSAGLKTVFAGLMEEARLTPLFNYRYQVSAPPGVNGVQMNARGWFDFSEAWLPPPETSSETGAPPPRALP